MIWHTLPRRAPEVLAREANYRSLEHFGVPLAGQALDPIAARLDSLVGPYLDVFAYGASPSRNDAALIEGLLRIAACNARLEAQIIPLWQRLAAVPLSVAEDENKQRVDRLFGLDGEAGLLGALKRQRRVAAESLPAMSAAEQGEFRTTLIALAGQFLPGGDGVDLWAWRGVRKAREGALPVLRAAEPEVVLALPVYLQALALVVLVQRWIGGTPGAAQQAAMRRHHAFLTSGADWSHTVSVADAVSAAAAATAL